MRRLTAMLVVAAVCGTVFSLGVFLGRSDTSPAFVGERGPIGWMLLAPSAVAQEVMQFKAVPAESLTRLERPRRARTAPPAVAAPPAPPSVPSVPVPPVPPVPPDLDQSGDMVRFGSDIVVREGQVVTGDVVAMGGDVTIDGHVEKDVVAMGGDVFLGPTGRVDGQVVTLGGKLHEQPGSHVGGQRVTAEGLPRGWFPGLLGWMGVVSSGVKAMWTIAKMTLLLLIAWGITQLAPQRTRTAVDAFKNEPVKSLGFGLLAWALAIPSVVALALVAAILCITIIGIPLALAVILGYALALILLVVWGYVVGAAVLGERLARQFGRPAASLALMAVWGIVALTVIRVVGHLFGAIPMGGFAGGMLVFLAAVIGGVLTTVGAGALLWTQLRRDALRQWWPGFRDRSVAAAAPAGSAPAPSPAPMPATEPPAASPPSLGV